MALAWEGPDLLLICFMGGLLAENFNPELTGIRKRTSEVKGLEIRGSVSDTSLVTSNMESRLQHYKIECRSYYQRARCWAFPAPFTLGEEMAAWWIRPCGCQGRPIAPSSSYTRRRDSQSHQKPGALSTGRLVLSHWRMDASLNSWGFNRLDIVPAFGIHR